MAGLTKEQKAEKALLDKMLTLSGLSAEAFAAFTEQEREEWSAKAKSALEQETEQATKGKKPVPSDDEADYSGLIKVRLAADEIYVHPTCLADHQRLGWEEV